jgi:hypothetical protein
MGERWERLGHALCGLSVAMGIGLGSGLVPGGPGAGQARAEAVAGSGAEAALAGQVAALAETMKIPDVVEILREEGVAYGATLDESMFAGSAGPDWTASVEALYDAGRMQEVFLSALARELGPHADRVPAMEAFFGGDLGQRILTLELEARRALLDEAVEDVARLAWEEMQAEGGPRVDLLGRFVEANDLIESNVMGALNSNLAFYQGMAEGGAFEDAMTEEQMLTDTWAQEPQIRAQTEGWVFTYLALAYGPLSDEELDTYVAFSTSPEGQILNDALFAAFDEVFRPISRGLGLAAARQLQGQDI